MSDQPPDDPTKRPMPWDPQQPASNSNPPEPPPDAAPTEVTPTPQPPPPDAPPPGAPPLEPPSGEPAQPGLISAAPVGWGASQGSTSGLPPTPPGPAGPGGPTVGWAAPPPVNEVPGAPGLAFADTGSRFVAYIIDSIILAILGGIIGAALGSGTTAVVQTANGVSSYSGVTGAAFTVAVTILSLLYFVFFWTGGRRATLGQRVFNLQVGNAFDGHGLTLEQAVRRWLGLAYFVGLFALIPNLYGIASLVQFLWVIVLLITTATSPTKQGLHDRFANSAVVRPAGQGSSGLAMACIVIVVILLVIAVLSFVALILVGSQVSTILEEVGNSI
jgi:uncharacterized RDD family membrane protein YckC